MVDRYERATKVDETAGKLRMASVSDVFRAKTRGKVENFSRYFLVVCIEQLRNFLMIICFQIRQLEMELNECKFESANNVAIIAVRYILLSKSHQILIKIMQISLSNSVLSLKT